MTTANYHLRMTVLAAALLVGSCSTDKYALQGVPNPDGAENHPIVVEPSDRSLRLSFSATEAGLMPEDAVRLEAFVGDYLNGGSGAISVSAPAGPGANEALSYFGEKLALLGVPRSRILVGTREVAGRDEKVKFHFISYEAHTDQCGDWSADLAETTANATAPNLGCSNQQNIAAMVTDPRDLITPEPESAADATHRAAVLGHYEQGQVTGSAKNSSQSGTVSDVGTSGGGQ